MSERIPDDAQNLKKLIREAEVLTSAVRPGCLSD